ncbi:MAG: hypothetical protein GEV08_11690 [Acidimicrobiia bacterium]|nr:hypothetical protein [Acidimicrobiia bacterium]
MPPGAPAAEPSVVMTGAWKEAAVQRYLVVANQTLAGRPLLEAVQTAMAAGPCRFHVVVPATPPRHQLSWTEGGARSLAAERLERTLTRLAEVGADVTGEVGDASPILAIGDALLVERYDHLVLSTFPAGISRWLHQDLPHRAERTFGLPITHVVTDPAETAADLAGASPPGQAGPASRRPRHR